MKRFSMGLFVLAVALSGCAGAGEEGEEGDDADSVSQGVEASDKPAPLTCAPAFQQVSSGAVARVYAQGGGFRGEFQWYAPEGQPGSGTGPRFGVVHTNPNYLPQIHHVYVSKNGQSASCTIRVLGAGF